MKSIQRLNDVKRYDPKEKCYVDVKIPKLKELDPRGATFRTPLIFLVDGSGSLSSDRDQVNSSLSYLYETIHARNSSLELKQLVDLSVIVFGKSSDNEIGVEFQREFDLVEHASPVIRECSGTTPLGEAMLYAYMYGVVRKKHYKRSGFGYSQPIVVLISDLGENDSGCYLIDGQKYSGKELFKAMAELYTYQMNEEKKQYTYVVPMGTVSQEERQALAKVDFRGNSEQSVNELLNSIIEVYVASVQHVMGGEGIDVDVLEGISASGEEAPHVGLLDVFREDDEGNPREDDDEEFWNKLFPDQ